MRVSVNDTELYLDVEGGELAVDGERLRRRPTLLALHGGPGFDQGYLRPGLRPLANDAQLVFVDLRGQGRSARPPVESCTLEQMADDVAALCHRLGIEHPIVFGHSAGGFVALHLALRHVELPCGLILCDSAPTLAPLPDDAPPAGLVERAGADAVAVAQRLFAGDFCAACRALRCGPLRLLGNSGAVPASRARTYRPLRALRRLGDPITVAEPSSPSDRPATTASIAPPG